MLLITAASLLLIKTATAVFADEAYNVDYHYALLGEPQASTTFFHRPDPNSRASLIYTLSEQNVIGALNPKDGSVVWRQLLQSSSPSNATYLRTTDGSDLLVSGFGQEVSARSAADGKLAWTFKTSGELQDVEMLDFGSKDTIALYGGDSPAVVRLDESTGSLRWKHQIEGSDVPYKLSASATKVHLILLHKTILGYLKIRIVILDPATGQTLSEYTLSSESELASPETISAAGANTASPIIAWTDAAHSVIKINVLGSKNIASFNVKQAGTVQRVVLHAPSHSNSLSHFLVHYQAETENWADVFHIDLKSGKIEKAYSLPSIREPSTFSASTIDANVYFSRISKSEILTVSSASHGILGRWSLRSFGTIGTDQETFPEFAVTELSVKGDSVSAIRSAVWLSTGELVLLRDNAALWHRPEALADTVKAEFEVSAEAKKIALEAGAKKHGNPLSAFVQRLTGHVQMLASSLLGGQQYAYISALLSPSGDASNSFGFDRTIICTTSKGRVFGIDAGAAGRIRYALPSQSAASISLDELSTTAANASVEFREENGRIEAYSIGGSAQSPLWTFTPKEHERILSIVPRPVEDPVASIGIVLGNRNVLYKYLNPNLALVTTANNYKRTATFHIVDTVSGAILFASTHQNVDLSMPITSSLSQNWFAYSFTAETSNASPKGHLLIGGELYESLSSNDRGLLEAASNFSSLASSNAPFVLTQTYHISEPISNMAVTCTRQGITSKQLIVVLPESNSILGIPRGVIDPRRPNRDPTKEEQMEGLVKYSPTLEFDPRWQLNHRREVLGVKDVIASPALLESTSLIFAYGLDIFGTRLSPSFNFDMLGKDFNKFQMLSTVAALAVTTVVVGPLVMRKKVNARWNMFT